jgi:Domain of unknown function (DUF1990)
MKIYLSDQTKYFKTHLENLKLQDIIKYDKSQLKEKTTFISINTNKSIKQLDTNFFWDYNIFPNNIMSFLTEWTDQKRQMQIGDTIVQQAFIPPFRLFSQKIIFGVRINNIIDEENRIGFSYETLNGHVEMGESTFTIEKTKDDKTIFKIHTFSKPGNILTKLVGPIFSIPYQTFCTKRGLENVQKQLEI